MSFATSPLGEAKKDMKLLKKQKCKKMPTVNPLFSQIIIYT